MNTGLVVGAGLVWAAPAEAARVALVVGNDQYEHAGRLVAAESDARLVAGALQQQGFDVELVVNADRREFDEAIADFRIASRGAEAALFYYAGHGVQHDGRNYLIPVDAELSDAALLDSQTIALERDLLSPLAQAGASLNLIFLDACRNSPFASQWAAEERAARRGGLAEVTAAPGFVVAFATAPGRVARDGKQDEARGVENGPYAEALANAIVQPYIELQDVLKQVNGQVRRETLGAQVPWNNQALDIDFYFGEKPVVTLDPDLCSADPRPDWCVNVGAPSVFREGLTMPQWLVIGGGGLALGGAALWAGAWLHWEDVRSPCAEVSDSGGWDDELCPDDMAATRSRDQSLVWVGAGITAVGLLAGGAGGGLWFYARNTAAGPVLGLEGRW